MWRFSAHSIGTKASFVHLSLVASRWGHPAGRVCCFAHSIVTKPTFVSCSVFLQDGVPLSGLDLLIRSRMKELLQLGSWEQFPASPRGVLVSSFGRPVCSVAEWVPRSVVFASGMDCVCGPLANEGMGLGPVASRPPLGIGLAGDAFHLGVSMRRSSTHGGAC